MAPEWSPVAGGTLLMDSGPAGEHLFVVVFAPARIAGHGIEPQTLLIPFCSVRPEGKHDTACVIDAGGHPFIKHTSYLDYRNARVETVRHLRACVGRGVFKECAPVSVRLLERIQAGLRTSRHVARHIKESFAN